jgi:hypothetical protein
MFWCSAGHWGYEGVRNVGSPEGGGRPAERPAAGGEGGRAERGGLGARRLRQGGRGRVLGEPLLAQPAAHLRAGRRQDRLLLFAVVTKHPALRREANRV